jgi:hypothetical protein
MAKTILGNKLEGTIRVGRPRIICLQDIADNLRELKMNRWRQKVNYIEKWTFVVMEVENFQGPQGQ